MQKFKPQHNRLLFIDKKIREKSFPNLGSLAAEWEVSAKTIQRDIDYLRYVLDAPIRYNAAQRGFYYSEEHYRLPAIPLNDSDLFALFIAEKLLEQYAQSPIYPRLRSFFAKVLESLPDKVTLDPGQLENRFSLLGVPSTQISPAVWETIFAALRENRQIRMSHTKPGENTAVERTIDPYHVVNHQGEWYVIAFCGLRNGIRTFAMSRIGKAEPTGESFALPEDFDPRAFAGESFGIRSSEEHFHIKILFKREVSSYILERVWQDGQEIVRQDDGTLVLCFDAGNLLDVKRWVLSWGGMAKVLAPPELRDDIQQELEQMRKEYE